MSQEIIVVAKSLISVASSIIFLRAGSADAIGCTEALGHSSSLSLPDSSSCFLTFAQMPSRL